MCLKNRKKLKWLFPAAGIAVVVILLFFLQGKADKPYTIDRPYEYPLEYQSEEWYDMDPQQRWDAYTVPQEIIDSMTTEALLDTVINNPFLSDAWAYPTSEQMVEVVIGLNGARGIDGAGELMAREDLKAELDRARKKYPEGEKESRLSLLELVYECYVLNEMPGF